MIASRCWSLSLLLLLGACGADAASGPPAAAADPAVAKLVLGKDPGDAKSVKAAKAAGATERAVVFGRIGMRIEPGLAMFTLVDTELPYCGEKNTGDNCKTPWDYCCENKDTILANSLLVEVRGADGKPIATPALPELRLLDAVKVTGKLITDDHGNLALLADGLFRVQRPKVPDDLRWPQ
ncbi:MAG TPA: hypothetical protein VFT55_06195 [Planctomycetota bacterium]|nr:hypothetical protein [Planctomycetota bacterium]